MSDPLGELRAAVAEAAAALAARAVPDAGARAAPTLERPPREDFGDYSTNAALLLAPVAGQPPRTLAGDLGAELRDRLASAVARVDVAGPGFLNLFMADRWFRASLRRVLEAGGRYGGGGATRPERIDIEFVSANPTGPLTVAHGRHAAFGDALSRILEFHGHRVEREFYVNDFGSQVLRLGESIHARVHGEAVPEDGYRGEYVGDLVDHEAAQHLDVPQLARAGVEANLKRIRATLEAFGVRFDTWFAESTLHAGEADGGDAVARALDVLEQAGEAYSSEGALWLRSTAYGDDKDRVLRRSSGEPTYLAADIAYHQTKLARGFDRFVNVLGADHHGYVRRMQAAFQALGGTPGALELLILQFVHLIERGERASMSKRSGEFVSLDDLMTEIGVDAARFFLLTRSHDTTVDLDLDLAREQSAENPVYYVQYAHARIASMLERAGSERVDGALAEVGAGVQDEAVGASSGPAGAAELHPTERVLVKRVLAFPDEVGEAAVRRAPHRIASYALELAQDFTAFYRDCRVVGAEDEHVESWRIGLSVATQRTIGRALGLLGVGAPESM